LENQADLWVKAYESGPLSMKLKMLPMVDPYHPKTEGGSKNESFGQKNMLIDLIHSNRRLSHLGHNF